MILAAGKGSRLAPLTDSTPKPLLPVLGVPIIFSILGRLKAAGVSDVVINTHHLGEQIETALGSGSSMGLSIAYSREKTLLETGGGIKQALPLLQDDTFLICNGDIFCDFDFTDLPNQLLGDDLAHLVLVPKPASRTEGDFCADAGRLRARGDDYVYAGIAVLHRNLFQNAPQGPFSLRDLLFDAMEQGRVAVQIHTGHWSDIGTPADYAEVNRSAS